MKALFSSAFSFLESKKVPLWAFVIVGVVVLICFGVFMIYLAYVKRKYSSVVHERNVLEEAKKSAEAKKELEAFDAKKAVIELQIQELNAKIAAKDKELSSLQERLLGFKEALDRTTDWNEITINK